MFLTKLPVWGFPTSILRLCAFYKGIETAASEVLCKVQTLGRSLELTSHWEVLQLRNLGKHCFLEQLGDFRACINCMAKKK